MFGKSLATLFTVAAAALSVSALTIDTPKNLTQCNTVTLTWHGKMAPFVLAVLPSCDSEIEEPLLELPPMNATTYQWTVNVPSKMGSIAFVITDAGGNEAYTDEVQIGKSDNDACLSSASSSAPSSVAPTSTKAAATSGTVRTTLVVGATSATASASASASATSTPSTPVNVGGNNGGNSSGGSGGNTGVANSKVSGAIANTASVLASMIGVATGLLVLV
ncbi:hypothetical protein FRC06_004433 [Ceratobasidium sp. 370]|nr:hypothetical protein FRC06_004433 [Ceratobasidium sp. 370]